MSVYFIHDSESRAFKVGISQNVKARLRTIQSSNPNELELLGTIDGGIDKEQEIHGKLWKYNLRGEWFRWCPETAYYLEGLGLDVEIPPIHNFKEWLKAGMPEEWPK